jgi:hypothetical protein
LWHGRGTLRKRRENLAETSKEGCSSVWHFSLKAVEVGD